MARVVDSHFAEGWQKAGREPKSYASEIHHRGKVDRAATEAAEKTIQAAAQAAQKTQEPAKPAIEKQPAALVVKDIPQSAQTASQVSAHNQAQAAKNLDEARQNFMDARQNARNLETLEKKTQPTQNEPITREPVVQKSQPSAADLGKQQPKNQIQPNIALPSERLAQKQNAAQNKADTHNLKPRQKGTDNTARDPLDLEKALANTKPAAVSPDIPRALAVNQKSDAATDAETLSEDKEEKITDGDKAPEASAYTAKTHPGAEKRRELGSLLGGFAGGNSDASQNGKQGSEIKAIALAEKSEPLPETDPAFKVYNEFDSQVTGPETIKGKALVFKNHVIKEKLVEIAKFDKELGSKMKEMFKPLTLNERIIGDKFREDLQSFAFLKSVYGGVIG